MVSLTTLWLHAGVDRWNQVTFFTDCTWAPPCLLIVGREDAEYVARNWGSKMRDLVPELTIKVKPPVPPKVRRPRPLWKAGHAPTQEDLL